MLNFYHDVSMQATRTTASAKRSGRLFLLEVMSRTPGSFRMVLAPRGSSKPEWLPQSEQSHHAFLQRGDDAVQIPIAASAHDQPHEEVRT